MKHKIKYLLVALLMIVCSQSWGQTTKWSDVHQVAKRETIFGIAKSYNVSIQDLLNANPEMKVPGYELKKGTWIFVPFAKAGDQKAEIAYVNNSSAVTPTAPQVASNVIKVGVMLPLHNNDGDGKRMIEFYRGMLLAFNELKKEGITTDVHAWNVPIDGDINKTLQDRNAASMNMIFGPLYSNQVKTLSDFCKNHGIKMIVPFSINGNEIAENTNFFQVYENEDIQSTKAIAAFLERFKKSHHPVFIDCNDDKSKVGAFTSTLRRQLELDKVAYDLTNLNSSDVDFAKHFSKTVPNVVILNSEKSPQLNAVITKLNTLTKANSGLAISLYGYNQWFMYQDYVLASFFKYNVYIPSTYYYNKNSDKTRAFEKLYTTTYGEAMNNTYIPRIAINGYDQVQFFVRGYKKQGAKFKGVASDVAYKSLQNRFNFEKIGQGGYRNKFFQLIHFKLDQTLESLVY